MRWENFVGPRGIQKLISIRRKEGIVLPFSVSVVRGSRYALVTEEMPDLSKFDKYSTSIPARNKAGKIRWSKYLKFGDLIRLKGSFFKVISGDEYMSAYDESSEINTDELNLNIDSSMRKILEDDNDESKSQSSEDSGNYYIYIYVFIFLICI